MKILLHFEISATKTGHILRFGILNAVLLINVMRTVFRDDKHMTLP
mgnify:CR=1